MSTLIVFHVLCQQTVVMNELPSDANSYRERLAALVAAPHMFQIVYMYLQGCGGRSTDNCMVEDVQQFSPYQRYSTFLHCHCDYFQCDFSKL